MVGEERPVYNQPVITCDLIWRASPALHPKTPLLMQKYNYAEKFPGLRFLKCSCLEGMFDSPNSKCFLTIIDPFFQTVRIHMYTHIYIHIYIYIYKFTHTHSHTHTHTHTHTHIYIYIYIYIYITAKIKRKGNITQN